ncbi:MAG TPA: HEAT repeat domain-containing protein [Planctomycetota bacterium]|nr:HEAT repeat domain-containing protein [Planctomycetota bacterium]
MRHPSSARPQAAAVVITAHFLVHTLASGCSSTSEPSTGDVKADLQHADPRFRIRALFQAVEENRADLLEDIVRSLSDDDPGVMMFAATALRKITGQDFDFKPHGTAGEREDALRRWEEWIVKKKIEAEAEMEAVPGVRGRPGGSSSAVGAVRANAGEGRAIPAAAGPARTDNGGKG